MVIGHVQGMSGVPPVQPEGGGKGEMNSGGLWWAANIEPAFAPAAMAGRHPAANIEP
jgi:hypothetical protein